MPYRKTTLTVREETRQRLENLKIIPAEPFDAVLNRILDRFDELLRAIDQSPSGEVLIQRREPQTRFRLEEGFQIVAPVGKNLEQPPTARTSEKKPK